MKIERNTQKIFDKSQDCDENHPKSVKRSPWNGRIANSLNWGMIFIFSSPCPCLLGIAHYWFYWL